MLYDRHIATTRIIWSTKAPMKIASYSSMIRAFRAAALATETPSVRSRGAEGHYVLVGFNEDRPETNDLIG